MKKKLCIILVLFLCFLPENVFAFRRTQELNLRWENLDQLDVTLSERYGKLNILAYVNAINNNASIQGTIYLQRKNGGGWIEVDSWSVNDTGGLSFSETVSGTPGKTYRVYVVLYIDGERVSKTSNRLTL